MITSQVASSVLGALYPRRRRGLVLAALLTASMFTASSCDSAPLTPTTLNGEALPGASVDIVVDLRQPESGEAQVLARFSGLSEGIDLFKAMGKDPEYLYSNITLADEDGTPVAFDVSGRRLRLNRSVGGTVELRYTVKPGGLGRHGHQGMVAENFSLFNGRMFILPARATELESARIRFELPEDWVVASALREEGGWYYTDVFGEEHTADVLSSSCIGAGPYELTTKTIGTTEYRVYSYGGWSTEHKENLAKKSLGIFDWFHGNLGFDLGAPYAVIWSPKVDSSRLFGGSHANGTCFEHPKDRVRNWELLSHRVGHSMNKYNPSGMHIRDGRDHWFKEGFASYVEVMATAGSGAAPSEASWNDLLSKHRRRIAAHPDWDVTLGHEPAAKGDMQEYLHYTKGPVVAKLLDQVVRDRTDTTLLEFMRAMWTKYGRYQGAFPVRAELEAFTGANFDDFWALHVDAPGPLYSVWEEALADRTAPVAVIASGQPFSGKYLYLLAHSGDFEHFSDIRDFVAREPIRRAELAAMGVHLLPTSMRDRVAELSIEDRYGLARAEAAYGEHRRPKDLALPEVPPVIPAESFVLQLDDPDGLAFSQLLADEAAYEASLGTSGVGSITLTLTTKKEGVASPAVLAFAKRDSVVLHSRWRLAPGRLTVLVMDGEDVETKRAFNLEPGWTHSRSTFTRGDRPKESGVVRFKLFEGDTLLGTRSFWQR
jgi:hypothetical protein